MSQRSRVIELYKKLQYLGKKIVLFWLEFKLNLFWLGREWPQGPEKFRVKCKAAFAKNVKETDPEKIEKFISHGEIKDFYLNLDG